MWIKTRIVSSPHSPFPIPHSPFPIPHFLSDIFCSILPALQERRQGSNFAADLLAVSHDRLDPPTRIFRDVIIDRRGAGLQQQNHCRAAEFEISFLFASREPPAVRVALNDAPDARGADVDVKDFAEVRGLEYAVFAPVFGEDGFHPP